MVEEMKAKHLALGEKAKARYRAIFERLKEVEKVRAAELFALSNESEADLLAAPRITIRCEARK